MVTAPPSGPEALTRPLWSTAARSGRLELQLAGTVREPLAVTSWAESWAVAVAPFCTSSDAPGGEICSEALLLRLPQRLGCPPPPHVSGAWQPPLTVSQFSSWPQPSAARPQL